MRILISLLLFYSFSARALSPICLNVLGAAGFTETHMRTDVMTELTKRYKNDPEFASWYEAQETLPRDHSEIFLQFEKAKHSGKIPSKRVELFGPAGKMDAEVTNLILPAARWGDRRTGTEYEMRVLTLRKGDTVVMSDGEYVLGEFLGYGNQNQIFAIEGQPEQAIKLPTNVLQTNTYIRTKVVEGFVGMESKIPPDVPRVRIQKTGREKDYVVVSRIHGEENGEDFLKKVYRLNPKDPTNSKRYARLMELSEKVARAKDPRITNFEDGAFQFVWDKNLSDWVLADWEPPRK